MRVALWPRRSFGRSFSYYKHRVLRLQASPHAIAAGVAAGVFASFTPFVGLHFLLSFAVAWVIGGSMIAAAFGTAVGNPLTFPFIWLSSFQLGELVLGAGDVPSPLHFELSFDLLWNSFSTLWPTLKLMLIGGTLIGLVVGGIFYFVVRSAVLMSRALRSARLQAAMQNIQQARADAAARSAEALDGGPVLNSKDPA
ncbi:DUF2062 domain-containing protein [Acuticoccus kandeliae]|uniref:DUF2062 domain-containing protein n=1 Tax=Acuticoccus kandeliae TaxID=2073160 RepID=UPI000D3E577A|nr:DUF2062 domain-containing protein [Acuticoccus kandeliae]